MNMIRATLSRHNVCSLVLQPNPIYGMSQNISLNKTTCYIFKLFTLSVGDWNQMSFLLPYLEHEQSG